MFDLHGQIAVVTGASSGLGVTFAKALAGQGADIVILARREEMMKETAAEIEALGVKCHCIKTDVTDSDSIAAAAAEIKKEYGRVDILVNNAGVVRESSAEEYTDEYWNLLIDTNLSGVFKCAREFAKSFMIPQQYGRIINIASVYGLVANNHRTAGAVEPNFAGIIGYHASKGGVVNITRALAAEWAHFGITVNAIAPGYIAGGFGKDADQTLPKFADVLKCYCPMARQGKVDELRTTVVYLAAKETAYTTGVIIPVDGGWSAV